MSYEAINFEHLLGTQGFSDEMLKNHFTLYQGYVTNTNKLNESLQNFIQEGKIGKPEYNELKRRLGWEWNGIRLHELYFGNMTREKMELATDSHICQKLSLQFGNLGNWINDFKATGSMRGIGWTVLYHDPERDVYFNVWINEHNVNHLAGCRPLLVLDVFEHAYSMDYGLKRADYIEAFWNAIDWSVVCQRFGEME